MVKCVIVGCTSGYKSNTEKIHQFCAPKDVNLRKKWQTFIPRKDFILGDKSYVCEKHFREEDIVKFWESGPIKIPYKQWRLKKGVVPSLFSDPVYLSDTKKQRKPPTVRCHNSSSKKKKQKEKVNLINNPEELNVIENIKDNLFQQLLVEFKLCGSWQRLPMSEKSQELCFVTFNLNSNLVPTVERCVKVDKRNQITFAVKGKIIKLKEYGIDIIPGKNVHQFLENLKEFEAIKLCYGGPSADMFPDASKNLCTLTSEGLLQHHECDFIINKSSKATCCEKCDSLKNVLMCRKRRKTLHFFDIPFSKKLPIRIKFVHSNCNAKK